MSKKVGKYKLGKYEYQKWLGDNGQSGNVSLSSTQLVSGGGKLTVTGVLSGSGEILSTKVTEVSDARVGDGTGQVDLTDINTDHKVFLTGTISGSIKLPQATSTNTGMVIDVFCGTSVSGSIGFADSGDTVMPGGNITVHSRDAKVDSIPMPASTKAINLDSERVDNSGGGEGSHYKFVYQAADTVFCEATGLLDGDGTVALDGHATSTTGV